MGVHRVDGDPRDVSGYPPRAGDGKGSQGSGGGMVSAQAVDAIYVNGKVVTVDRQFAIAEAFAVGGERFVAVGTDAEVRRLVGPATVVIDLGGRTVLPGFVD